MEAAMEAQRRFTLELTPAELKVTHTALHSLLDDFGRDERDVGRIVRRVLDRLPDSDEIAVIDIADG
jgi:hypothetical protein